MPETRNRIVSVCLPPEEVELFDFAAKECGQTRSSFFYILGRDRLRQMRLLPMPTIPKTNNGQAAHHEGARTNAA